jgi:SAM-dependent methyltransferase
LIAPSKAILEPLRRVRAWQSRTIRARRIESVNDLLQNEAKPDTTRAESDFDRLQSRYTGVQEYGYDLASVLARAARRAAEIMGRVQSGDRKLRILELGAGDGMLGVLFNAAGHDVTLVDIADWRASAAKNVRFLEADCCDRIPCDSNEFDLICSFNTFEHFSAPSRAFTEACRVTRAGGLLHFEFDPLYRSPWGLHAYRSLLMPYPQFLFSEDFLAQKLKETGIQDLGTRREELQPLNKWTGEQFMRLWKMGNCETVSLNRQLNEDHIDLIQAYPESFRGRGLSFGDVTWSGMSLWLKKRPAPVEDALHVAPPSKSALVS